jgi:hypothetical protein
MKLITVALSVLVLTFTSLSHAQEPLRPRTSPQVGKKRPIAVSCVNEPSDFIGARFCSALRDEIARSPRYEEASTGSRWTLYIDTTGDVLHPNGISSQAAVLTIEFNFSEVFIQSWAFQSNAANVKGEAWMLMNRVDAEIFGRTWKNNEKCVLDLNPNPSYSNGCPFNLRDSDQNRIDRKK